jgi:hypothetical protein
MPQPRINGTLQPVRTKLSTRYDPTKGYTVTQEYESAGDNLAGLAQQSIAAGMQVDWTANACKSRLIATTTGAATGAGIPEKTTSTWQLFTNDYQEDIRKSPAAIALGPVMVAQIDAAIKMITKSRTEGVDEDPLLDGLAQTYADFTAEDGLFPPDSNEKVLLDLMIHGTTSFEITFYSARAAISVPFLYAGAVPGVSPDSLMADLMGDIAVNGANDGRLAKWGWRRIGTGRTFIGNNRTEISIEWRLGSWPPILYPGQITALPE